MEPMDLLRQGVAVMPVVYGGKRPLGDWSRLKSELPTEQDMSRWGKLKTNWAAICGWQGLTVLDFDRTDAYELWLTWAALTGGAAFKVATGTYRVNTSRGVHLYLFLSEPTRSLKYGLVDVKGVGGYVLIPPSVHPSGTVYESPDPDAPILKVGRLSDVYPCDDSDVAPISLVRKPVSSGSISDPFQAAVAVRDRCVSKVATIKHALTILQFLPSEERRQTGRDWWVVKCPFHSDSTPSFWVNTKTQTCGCHAGCTRRSLDVIDLYARLHGLSNRDAIEELYRMC